MAKALQTSRRFGVARAPGLRSRPFLRKFSARLLKALFRLETRGLENMPPAGERVILAPNLASLIDGPLLDAALPFEAAFAVDAGVSRAAWAKPFLATVSAFRFEPTRPLATKHLVNVVKSGVPLVIFPEGRLTATGGLMKIYEGAATVADEADAWIVPVRIEGSQRSWFSRMKPWQIKKAWLPKVTIAFLPKVKLALGDELRGKARRAAATAALQELMIEAMARNAATDRTLFEAVVCAWRERDAGQPILEDAATGRISYRKLVLGAQTLGVRLAAMTEARENVGVLLPNANAVALAFFALQSLGCVPAMLNFTAGAQNLLSAMQAAEVKTVLTSRAFIAKARLEPLIEALLTRARVVYLEDVRAEIGPFDKLRGWLAGAAPRVARKPDDPAAILFTSGSEGAPKGVALSHRNILANVAQALARLDVNGGDKLFNALPVFHSFGMTGGLILPLVSGIPVYLYPSPLDYRLAPEFIYRRNATILFGTDTFLAGYARAAHPYDFRSLRLVIAGAEPLKPATREVYHRRFGLRIFEGYGATEAAPVIALNAPLADKPGTVGRLLPLMKARLEPVPGFADGGRLFVSGPNVMLGYLNPDKPGVIEPAPGGWHDTGDIVAIDDEGFITIKGRAKRFAKIAGEMVSLTAVEALASAAWPESEHAVVAVPDARKGERLVLLTTEANPQRETLLREARAKGVTELSVPAAFLRVERLPMLGTGKIDYAGAAALARASSASPADAA